MLAKAVIATGLVLTGVGCAPQQDVIATGEVRLEQLPPGSRSLRSIRAYERDGKLAVSGTWSVNPRRGHVDVTLLSPDGEILAETRTRFMTPSHHRQRHPSQFYTQLNVTPPDGSVLRVTLHFDDHPTQ